MASGAHDHLLGKITAEERQHVVFSAVGIDAESDICGQVGQFLREMLDEVREGLFDVLARKIDIEKVDECIREVTSDTAHRKLWLEEKNLTPVCPLNEDENSGCACVLVLSASHLVNAAERQSLVSRLAATRDSVSVFTLLFTESVEEALGGIGSPEALDEYIQDFLPLAPRRVCLYLVGPRLNNGRALETTGFAQAVAVALCGDLLIADAKNPRLLTDRVEEDRISLSTFGLEALRYGFSRVSESLVHRFLGDLLRRTLFRRFHDPTLEHPDRPSPPEDFLSRLFDNWLSSGFKPLAGKRGDLRIESGRPSVSGDGFVATALFDGLNQGVELARKPKGEWARLLYHWDFVLRHSRVPRWLARLEKDFGAATAEESNGVREALASVFVSDGGAANWPDCHGAMDERLGVAYKPALRGGDSRTLQQSLAHLHAALRAIPHGPSLALRGLSILAFQALLAWFVWQAGPSSARVLLLWIIGALGLLTVGVSLTVRMNRLSSAEKTMTRVLDDTENRCRLDFCNMLVRKLKETQSQLRGELEAHRVFLEALSKRLASLLVGDTSPENQSPVPERPANVLAAGAGGAVVSFPLPGQEDEFYEALVGTEMGQGGGIFADGFRSRLQAWIQTALQQNLVGDVVSAGESLPEKGVDALRFYARETFRGRMRLMRLWQFFRPSLSLLSEPGIDPAICENMLARLCSDREARVFLGNGKVVSVALAYEPVRFFMAADPQILRRNPDPGEMRDFRVGPRSAVAVGTRVELAHLLANGKSLLSET